MRRIFPGTFRNFSHVLSYIYSSYPVPNNFHKTIYFFNMDILYT